MAEFKMEPKRAEAGPNASLPFLLDIAMARKNQKDFGQTADPQEISSALAAYLGSIPDEWVQTIGLNKVDLAIRPVIEAYVDQAEGELTLQDAQAIDKSVRDRLSTLYQARKKAA